MPRPPRIEPSGEVVARVGATALALPDAYEEDAWTGVRWRVRNKTFAHVLVAQEGYTSAYRDLTGVTEPTTVLTFRSSGEELLALAHGGPRFYRPPWSPTVIGVVLDGDTDWDEVAELVTESYRFCAPKRLSLRLDRQPRGSGGNRVEPVHEHKRFDDASATWDDDPGHEARQRAVVEVIDGAVKLDPRMRALDIGGGTGRLSILLADKVGSVVVTDPSAGMVQVARERIDEAGLSDRLRAVQADLTTDRLEGTYDVAWSSMALHHVPDPDQLLRSVAGLLVDGGTLLIADLDEDPDGAFHADKVDFDGHHGFNRGRLAEQLAHAGFGDVGFVDATTILKGDREFGVFLCTATKGA